jgi:hypothetical protein
MIWWSQKPMEGCRTLEEQEQKQEKEEEEEEEEEDY